MRTYSPQERQILATWAIKVKLKSKGFHVTEEDNGLTVSFTSMGLDGVLATIPESEISLYAETLELPEV